MEYFGQIVQELQAAHGALVDASQAMLRAGEHVVTATEAALHARGEHEELRETVNRLQATVLDLVREVKALRENGGGA